MDLTISIILSVTAVIPYCDSRSSSFVQFPPNTSDVVFTSPVTPKELVSLERLNPDGDKPISRFAPGVLVKFGWDHDGEVRALQFIHGRLSVPTPCVLHHSPFPATAVVEPWNWVPNGVWYFSMDECRGPPLNTVIDGTSSPELNDIADQLIVILDEMRSYTSTTLGSVNGGPYNNRFMPYPWNPPHAFSSIEEYLDYYRSIFLNFLDKNMWTSCSAVSQRRQRSSSLTGFFSPITFSLKAPKLQGFLTGRPLGIILNSGNMAGCMT
jgi:hypothetical protein